MELVDLITNCQARANTARANLKDEQPDYARGTLLRMAKEIQDELKPPEKPEEDTDELRKQDGVASKD